MDYHYAPAAAAPPSWSPHTTSGQHSEVDAQMDINELMGDIGGKQSTRPTKSVTETPNVFRSVRILQLAVVCALSASRKYLLCTFQLVFIFRKSPVAFTVIPDFHRIPPIHLFESERGHVQF